MSKSALVQLENEDDADEDFGDEMAPMLPSEVDGHGGGRQQKRPVPHHQFRKARAPAGIRSSPRSPPRFLPATTSREANTPSYSTPTFSVHDRIEIEEPSEGDAERGGKGPRPSTADNALLQFIRLRFSRLYTLLAVVLFLAAVILLLSLLAFLTLDRMSEKVEEREKRMMDESEKFMRFYEALVRYQIDPSGLLTTSTLAKLPQEQLQQAVAFGYLPLTSTNSTTTAQFHEPIKPIVHHGSASGTNRSQHPSWYSPSCDIKCNRADVAIPPLLVISLDGYAHDYVQRGRSPTLEFFGDCGAKAEKMYATYPSKTFPSHYSMATGLYSESHGIVDNVIYDPSVLPRLEDVRMSEHSEYYLGEPIWSAAVRQHRRAFCLFWPGCSFLPKGSLPPTVNLKYNMSMPYSARVDTVVEWLSRPAAERPSLVMLYFDQPDSAGHMHENDAQVNVELDYVDAVLNYLFTSLHRVGMMDCTNVMIVSDHGMENIKRTVYLDEVFEKKGIEKAMERAIIAGGPVARIYFPAENGTDSSSNTETLLSALHCYNASQFRLYDRHTTPVRYHYSHSPRIGDFILDSRPGSIIYSSHAADPGHTANHGYDPILDDAMGAIFYARGPNIHPAYTLRPFQNIELFNLMIDLMRMRHDVENNGTLGVMDEVLWNVNAARPPIPLGSELKPILDPHRIYGFCSELKADIIGVGLYDRTSGLLVLAHFNGHGDKDECSPLTMFQSHELKWCIDSSSHNASCSADEMAGINKLLASPQCQFPYMPFVGLFYSSYGSIASLAPLRAPNTTPCLVNLCGMTVMSNPTIVHEILTDTDQMDAKRAGTGDRENCSMLYDARYDKATCSALNNSKKAKKGGDVDDDELEWITLSHQTSWALSRLNRAQRLLYHGFITGPCAHLRDYTSAAVRKYHRLSIFTGVLHDPIVSIKGNSTSTSTSKPTHLFRILHQCQDNNWNVNGLACKMPSATRVIAFVLPIVPTDHNCLPRDDFLLTNTARVRDIELLAGVQFFSERMWFPEKEALSWRTEIVTSLWPV